MANAPVTIPTVPTPETRRVLDAINDAIGKAEALYFTDKGGQKWRLIATSKPAAGIACLQYLGRSGGSAHWKTLVSLSASGAIHAPGLDTTAWDFAAKGEEPQ